MVLDISGDQQLTVFQRPFVNAILRVMYVAIKELTMIGIVHDLSYGRARALWNYAVDDALTFCHPDPWKTHMSASARVVR